MSKVEIKFYIIEYQHGPNKYLVEKTRRRAGSDFVFSAMLKSHVRDKKDLRRVTFDDMSEVEKILPEVKKIAPNAVVVEKVYSWRK